MKESVVVTLNDDQQTYSFRDDEDTTNTLLPQLTKNELNEKCGTGFKLMEALGYVAGQGLGIASQGIAAPLPSGDMLQDPSRHMGYSTDSAELVRRASSASIDPPRCSSCNEHRWPAYRTIRRG